jgi:hypothetical protein
MFLAVKQTVVLTEHNLLIGVGTTSAPAPAAAVRPFPRLPALDLEDLISMPGAKTMRYDKARTLAIAIMPSPCWGRRRGGGSFLRSRAPLVEHGTNFQR